MWTLDSQDASWMVEFRDFTCNSFANKNFDWKIVSDDPLKSKLEIYLVVYKKFQYRDQDHQEVVEKTRALYVKWAKDIVVLDGNITKFQGPQPSPIQRFQRKK